MLTNFNNKLMKALPAAMLVASAAYITAECVNRVKNPNSSSLAEQALNECENRVNTYRELQDNDVDITPYLCNYGKAQVALDSVLSTKLCNSLGLYPTTYKDAEFSIDSICAKECGIEPYKRTDDDATKAVKRDEILKAMRIKTIDRELEAMKQIAEAIEQNQKQWKQIRESRNSK